MAQQPEDRPPSDHFPWFALRCALVASLGGLLFGFDTAVISGTTDSIERVFIDVAFGEASQGVRDFWKGFTVASALIGTIIGAAAAGPLADRLGRRGLMFVLAGLFLASALGCAAAWDWASLVAARFLGGLAIGAVSVVSPMYIAEIAPAKYRGRLAGLAQFSIVLGILLAFFSNYVVTAAGDGEAWQDRVGWRVMFGVEILPAVAFGLALLAVPRSPRWLVGRGRDEEALRVLRRLSAGSDRPPEAQLGAIRRSLERAEGIAAEPLFARRHRRPVQLALAIAAFNQLSGINAILYYAPEVFASAGFGRRAAFLSSVGVGIANLVCTMAALAVIDRIGRRSLMLVGSVGYILSLGAAAVAFYTQSEIDDAGARTFTEAGGIAVLAAIVVFIASHAFGQGAVIWVFLGEIFPNAVRAKGQALGSLTHWVFAAAISWSFPVIAGVSGGHVFAFYALCMVGQLVWVLMVMPETKGVPLEEIEPRVERAGPAAGAS